MSTSSAVGGEGGGGEGGAGGSSSSWDELSEPEDKEASRSGARAPARTTPAATSSVTGAPRNATRPGAAGKGITQGAGAAATAAKAATTSFASTAVSTGVSGLSRERSTSQQQHAQQKNTSDPTPQATRFAPSALSTISSGSRPFNSVNSGVKTASLSTAAPGGTGGVAATIISNTTRGGGGGEGGVAGSGGSRGEAMGGGGGGGIDGTGTAARSTAKRPAGLLRGLTRGSSGLTANGVGSDSDSSSGSNSCSGRGGRDSKRRCTTAAGDGTASPASPDANYRTNIGTRKKGGASAVVESDDDDDFDDGIGGRGGSSSANGAVTSPHPLSSSSASASWMTSSSAAVAAAVTPLLQPHRPLPSPIAPRDTVVSSGSGGRSWDTVRGGVGSGPTTSAYPAAASMTPASALLLQEMSFGACDVGLVDDVLGDIDLNELMKMEGVEGESHAEPQAEEAASARVRGGKDSTATVSLHQP